MTDTSKDSMSEALADRAIAQARAEPQAPPAIAQSAVLGESEEMPPEEAVERLVQLYAVRGRQVAYPAIERMPFLQRHFARARRQYRG